MFRSGKLIDQQHWNTMLAQRQREDRTDRSGPGDDYPFMKE